LETVEPSLLPSLPGYGFTGEPKELGWDSARIARAWAKLMERLGYTRYVAQRGDVGADVADAMGRHAPKGLLCIHLNLLAGALGALVHAAHLLRHIRPPIFAGFLGAAETEVTLRLPSAGARAGVARAKANEGQGIPRAGARK
jgi:hypothetical protein